MDVQLTSIVLIFVVLIKLITVLLNGLIAFQVVTTGAKFGTCV